MAANTIPVFVISGDCSTNGTTGMAQFVTAAAADYTGIGANNTLAWTADATNGGRLERLRFKAAGSNVATVARIYINNAATNGTATNNTLYAEVELPATTATATGATVNCDYEMNISLPAGHRIYWGLGTAVAAGWNCIGIGGKF